MTRALRCGSLIGVLIVGFGCGTEGPTTLNPVPAPSTTPPPTPPPLPPPTPPPPPPGELVATYVFSDRLDYAVGAITAESQYLLYANEVFEWRNGDDSFFSVWRGTYRQENATLTFRFSGRWTDDAGFATGTLQGDLLEVRYSEIMEHSGFENAVYRRSQ